MWGRARLLLPAVWEAAEGASHGKHPSAKQRAGAAPLVAFWVVGGTRAALLHTGS